MEARECSICQDPVFTDEGLKSLVLAHIYGEQNLHALLQDYSIQQCIQEAGLSEAFENVSPETLADFIDPFQCQGNPRFLHRGCF